MKVLLDTNIIIHREASTVVDEDIGVLFKWLDIIRAVKCIHPLTLAEVEKHKDPKTVKTFSVKLASYTLLKTKAPVAPEVKAEVGQPGLIEAVLPAGVFFGTDNAARTSQLDLTLVGLQNTIIKVNMSTNIMSLGSYNTKGRK